MYKKMLGILAVASIATNAQMAAGSPKFLGNITTNGAIRADYLQYWNQITGENECKWGSVEGVRDQYNWTGCDRIYNYAKQKGIPTKFHTLVWGSQYPSWLMSLSTADQLAEITEWFDEAKKRYPDLDMIDVVNEAVPGHAPAPFKAALGGDGATGYDWIITSFRMARERWPKALLIYNDYNALTWQRAQFIDLLNKVKGSGYIDAAGLQSHGLENFTGAQIKTYLEEIRTKVGLPIMISEYDLAFADDNAQKNKLAEQFPIFWEADYVGGVTMWGYVVGSTWVANTGLIRANNTERPSMTWLKSYIASHKSVKSSVDFSVPGAPKFTNPYRKVSSSSSATVSSSSKPSSSSAAVSSSSKVSSSSVAVSSSSATGLKACIAFVNGVGGYGSNCYKSGLASMAANTCYTMNPARGTAPAWINNNANDTWWWSITSCTGIKARMATALQYDAAPSRYLVYDLNGQLVQESAFEPRNLGAGSWIVVARDASGKQISRRTVQIRD
jgi:GH35 family endo-1,4-beta-xylanase